MATRTETSEQQSFVVTWEIDAQADSAAAAAAEQWLTVFNRGPSQPSADEACVFEVTDATGWTRRIDLSEQRYARLFS